ncbi:hypothetical protein ID866_11871 [Astraeus odoratus]|nr:hypothetical protein ID866_11871 [Astraeus odoratus]
MSTCKSSMVMGALAEKSINWTKVPDEELATDLDDTDLVGDAKAQEKHRRLCMAHNTEIRRAEGACKQKPGECVCMYQMLEARAYVHHTDQGQEAFGMQVMHEGQGTIGAMSPRGGDHKKWVKKVADKDEDNEIVILSGRKTRRQGGGKALEKITDRWWGELIQAVSSHMDIANGHLEKIASTAQSNRQKMQCHYMLMEGLVSQQQVLLSKLVEITSTAGSRESKEVIKGQKEPRELQEEELGGQEGDTEGAPGGAPEGEPEDAPGNELENGAGVEDGVGEEG